MNKANFKLLLCVLNIAKKKIKNVVQNCRTIDTAHERKLIENMMRHDFMFIVVILFFLKRRIFRSIKKEIRNDLTLLILYIFCLHSMINDLLMDT